MSALTVGLAVAGGTAAAEWTVWTTQARLVVTDPSALEAATELVRRRLDEVDIAASRFRRDSEVSTIAASGRRTHRVSPVLADLLTAALVAAEETHGAVDPTVGTVLIDLGYGPGGLASHGGEGGEDAARTPMKWSAGRRVTWRDVTLDDDMLRLPSGTLLDLGATAKAVAADRCAVQVAERFGCGVLLSLGGDVRVAGPEPAEGWNVLVQDGDGEPSSQIRLTGAQAVATSSTLHRRWHRDGRQLHHVIDPRALLPAREVWRTATVAAATCLRANTLSTQAVVLGARAPSVLAATGEAARLVSSDATVIRIGGWPA